MPLRKILADPQLSRLILDQALDAFVAIDEHSVILEWSKQAEYIFGWTRDEAIGLRLTDTIIPERYCNAHLAGVNRHQRTGHFNLLFRRTEMPAVCRDGSEIPIELSVTPIIGSDRSLYAASIRDMSAEKALETSLQRQIEITQSILDSMADAVTVADLSDNVILTNPAAQRLWNLARNDGPHHVSQFSQNLLQSDGQTPCSPDEQPLIKALRGEKVTGWVGLIQNEAAPVGTWISATAHPLIGTDGAQLGAVAVYHDITELQKRQQMLMQQANLVRSTKGDSDPGQSRERYRLLVETATEFAMIVMDPRGIITSWNTGAEKVLGRPAQEVIGQPISSIFSPEDRERGKPLQELEKAVLVGRSEDTRWHTRKDGSRFWASGVVTPLWDESGRLLGFTKILRDQTARRLEEEQMQFLANHDPLTGLPNRIHLSDQLHRAIAVSDRNQTAFAVLLLDLDRFKYVNDTFGHHTGDLLLKQVAQRLLTSLRETDFIARLGGDEFVVIQTAVSQPHAAAALSEKLVQELGRPYQLEQHEVEIGTSIGIAIYPDDAENTVDLMKGADAALYRAKSKGREQWHFLAEDKPVHIKTINDRKACLRNALNNDEFRLYYQPQIDLNSWKISSVEALLRWQASDQPPLLPGDFIGALEEEEIAVEVGRWVLSTACRQVRQWQRRSLPDLRVAINCSAHQCCDRRFLEMICSVIQDTGLACSFLEIEVPESVLVDPGIRGPLAQLRKHGVRIIIDNFGTGPTSWIELKDMEADGLKIDKQLVQHLPHRHKDSAIAVAITQLAHNLGIRVAAGGVETPDQLAYLKTLDYNTAQGFIFSPPVSSEKFEELMLTGHWSRFNPPGDDGHRRII